MCKRCPKNSEFSNFIRNARGPERAAVFERVIDKSIEVQQAELLYNATAIGHGFVNRKTFGSLTEQQRAFWITEAARKGALPR